MTLPIFHNIAVRIYKLGNPRIRELASLFNQATVTSVPQSHHSIYSWGIIPICKHRRAHEVIPTDIPQTESEDMFSGDLDLISRFKRCHYVWAPLKGANWLRGRGVSYIVWSNRVDYHPTLSDTRRQNTNIVFIITWKIKFIAFLFKHLCISQFSTSMMIQVSKLHKSRCFRIELY